MKRKLTYTLSILLILFTAGVVGERISHNYHYFSTVCPSPDLLSWDANLRFIQSVDQYRDLKAGRIGRGLLPFLDSPTWPPLHSFLSLILFLFNPDGPDPVLDTTIGLTFFLLTLLSLFYVALRVSRSLLGAGVVWLAVALLLFFTREIPAYSLSSMLETQGMFFMLWSVYFLYRLYEERREERVRLVSDHQGEELTGTPVHDPALRRKLYAGLFLSAQGLFFTKYPYGIILMLAVAGMELFSSPLRYLQAVNFGLISYYRGFRRIILILFALILFILIFSRHITGFQLDTKAFKYGIYLLLLILFVDFNYFLRLHGKSVRSIVPSTASPIYFTVFLPSLVWLLIHPDRVMSTVGTQLHVQEQTRSFTLSFFRDVFDPGTPLLLFSLLLAAGFVSVVLYGVAVVRLHGEDDPESVRLFSRDLAPRSLYLSGIFFRTPLTAVSSLLVLQFLILELVTGNKQLRHIYHLLPSLLLVLALWSSHFPAFFAAVMDRKGGKAGKALLQSALILVTLGLSFHMLLVPPRLFDNTYEETRELCYTGKNPDVFEPARWIASRLKPGGKYMVINFFHNSGGVFPGRMLATDMDLLMRMQVGPEGDLRNDNAYLWKSWNEFDRLLVLYDRCDDPALHAFLEKRLREVGSTTGDPVVHTHPGGEFCLADYPLTHRSPGE